MRTKTPGTWIIVSFTFFLLGKFATAESAKGEIFPALFILAFAALIRPAAHYRRSPCRSAMSPKLADKVPCSQIGYMPLNMTKIAFGCESLPDLQRRIESRAAQNGGEMLLTTRYRPKRHEEMVGGSLYWIITHRLMARSPILRFDEAPDGRTKIILEPRAIAVESRPKRAHQGWRYLTAEDAPPDLGAGFEALSEMPSKMLGELTILGLV